MSGRRASQLLRRAWLLKCPRCGEGPLFRGFFAMHPDCPNCHLVFEREQGYFVGAIYVNYAATVGIVLGGFFLLDYWLGLSLLWQLLIWIPFATLFPLGFFRYSRSLWLGLEYFFNPAERLRVLRKTGEGQSPGRG